MPIQCGFCHNLLIKSEIKHCSSCKAVIYCSRECQKEDWKKEHKAICTRISNPKNAIDELSHWFTMWSPSLVYAATWALDIKNNPGHNAKYALMLFVEKTDSTDPAHRYIIIGQWLVPVSIMHPGAKRLTSDHFVVIIQEPATLAETYLTWKNPMWSIQSSVLSKPDSAMLGKLAVPILRRLIETVNHIDAMTMWDPHVWLSQPHPLVQPEDMAVLSDERARTFKLNSK